MKRLLLAFLTLTPLAFAQVSDIETELNHKYANHMVRLGVPLSGDSLAFDANAHSVKGRPGIFGLDDAINIGQIKLNRQEMIVEGARAVLLVSAADGSSRYGATKSKVRLRLALPNAPATLESAEAALAKVLLPRGSRSCSAEEAADFAGTLPSLMAGKTANPPGGMKCLPTGGRGYVGGVEGPKAIVVRPPKMPEQFRQDRGPHSWSGKITILALIDEKGLAQDAVIVAGPDAGALCQSIEVVHDWRFRPARKDGSPIPSVVTLSFELGSFTM